MKKEQSYARLGGVVVKNAFGEVLYVAAKLLHRVVDAEIVEPLALLHGVHVAKDLGV